MSVVRNQLRVNVFNVDAALAIGQTRGMFAAERLDVEILLTPNSTDQMRGLSKGSWQIVSTAFDNVLGWSGREGAEIIAVVQVAQGITLPVYVRSEIKSWKDLRGKPLAVDAVDTAYALVLRRILLAHDLDMNRGDYQLVAVGATGQRLESMNHGDTFAAILNPPWDSKAAAAGHVRMSDHREVLPDYPGGVFAVNHEWAGGHGEMLIQFLRIWNKALRWAQDAKNRADAIRLVAEDQKLDEKAAARRLSQLPSDGQLKIAGLQTVLDLRVQFGLTPAIGKDLKRYYDLNWYQRAVAG